MVPVDSKTGRAITRYYKRISKRVYRGDENYLLDNVEKYAFPIMIVSIVIYLFAVYVLGVAKTP